VSSVVNVIGVRFAVYLQNVLRLESHETEKAKARFRARFIAYSDTESQCFSVFCEIKSIFKLRAPKQKR